MFARVALLFFVSSSAAAARDDAQTRCWETGCQRDPLPDKGCDQYGLTETKRVRCEIGGGGGGHVYTCCGPTDELGPSDDYVVGERTTRPATLIATTAKIRPKNTIKSGQMRYFHLATTACGKTYSDGDMVAAVGPAYFTTSDPNKDPLCGKRLKILNPKTSKTVVVKIVDKCGGCSKNDINVSPAAFKKIASLKYGVIKVKWTFLS